MTYRRAILPGVYRDAIQPGGRTMVRTYTRTGRKVTYTWHETDPTTGAGVWLIEGEEA